MAENKRKAMKEIHGAMRIAAVDVIPTTKDLVWHASALM